MEENREIEIDLRKILDNDANHTSVAVIDDLLHGVLQFCLTFISDHGDHCTA